VVEGLGAGVRKAADPGVVEQIAGFLSDNALTRSWAETVDRHVITPVELQFVKEMPPEDELNALAAKLLGQNGQLNERGRDFLNATRMGHNDPPGRMEEMLELISQQENEDATLRVLRKAASTAKGEGLRKSLDVLAPRDGRNGYTETGRQMRQFGLGSPVAAYSAVTAGGAMGTAAAMQAYDWWLSQQQQEQKESQLPLSPGI
jgi:hypothetical protein